MQEKMKLDFNTADLNQLRSVEGIGLTIAREIIEYREAHGPFHNCEELDQFVTPDYPNMKLNMREACGLV